MGTASLKSGTRQLSSQCFRLTARGRACVGLVEIESQTLGSLSRYLHDLLMTCGTGPWLQQLQQRMPPRPIEESLRALLTLGLIECFEPEELALDAPMPRRRGAPGFAAACA